MDFNYLKLFPINLKRLNKVKVLIYLTLIKTQKYLEPIEQGKSDLLVIAVLF